MASTEENAENISRRIIEQERFGPRQMPIVKFIEDVRDLVGDDVGKIQQYIETYREMHSKLQLMSDQLQRQLTGMESRITALKQSAQVIEMSKKHVEENPDKPVTTMMKADEVLYAQCEVTDPSHVMLWLGSNVVVEYTLKEAGEVLARQLEATQESAENLVTDVKHLREQTVVTEMAISRLYNLFVTLNQQAARAGGTEATGLALERTGAAR